MAARIVADKAYVAGWLDSSIHDFLAVLPPLAASTKYALITCLDSNPNPASMRDRSPELGHLMRNVQTVGNGLLVPTELLLEASSRHQIFFGFDEVWFFPNKSVEAKPKSVSLVGPARINRTRFNSVAKWMSANSCSLALGGREGMNFVIRAQGLVRFLLGFSIEQPEPSVGALEAIASR